MSIDELLLDHQPSHSQWQMDCFITARNGRTPYGCYKQALRELHSRHCGVQELETSKQLLGLETRKQELELEQKRRALHEMDVTLQDAVRERNHFHAQAATLKEELGELTPETRGKLDRDMWRHTLKCMAAVDLMSTGRLGRNTIESIMSTPMTWRVGLWREIIEPKALIGWFEKQDATYLLDNVASGPVLPEPAGGNGKAGIESIPTGVLPSG